VGLAQREIEAAGFSTIILSSIPDLTASVSVPRLAAIEYPLGYTLGRPNDVQDQTAVLRAVLQALEAMETPGEVVHLPFEWSGPEKPKPPEGHEPPPIVGHVQRHPLQLRRLLTRDVPQD
jgi:hypothetical protein